METKTTESPTGWLEFLRAHSAITRELDRALRSRHGLTLNEYEVLLKLWFAEGHRLRRVDLAAQMLITQGGITRLLAGLEERRLVKRVPSPEDRRVAFAQLTDAGAELLESARAEHLGDVTRLFAGRYSEDELKRFAEFLSRLIAEEGEISVGVS